MHTVSKNTLIELSGHLIDSLTLTKVIDVIQAGNCHYNIEAIEIGFEKQDLSYGLLSIGSDDDADLDAMLNELKAYGVKPYEPTETEIGLCPKDGTPPEHCFYVSKPPKQLMHQGQLIPIEPQTAEATVIVVNTHHKSAQITPLSALKQGDHVVLGSGGLSYTTA